MRERRRPNFPRLTRATRPTPGIPAACGYHRRMSAITPVILCGGSGTRLWPLSRKSFPKQFVPLIGTKSLLQLTLERVAGLGKHVVCVAADDHRFLVAENVAAARLDATLLLEPVARN